MRSKSLILAAALLSLAVTVPLPLHAELDMEALSRKISLWPRQITLVQDLPLKIKQPDGSLQAAKVPKGTVMEVISVQVKGVEVKFQDKAIVLPPQFTDLEAQVAKRQATENAPADPEAVKQKLSKFLEDETLSLEELKQLTKAEIATLPPEMQTQINEAIKTLSKPSGEAPEAQGSQPGGRPKPVLQSRDMTPFVKEITENAVVIEGNNLRKYTSTLKFRDKDYYLLYFGAGFNENTRKLNPAILDYYKKVTRFNDKFEILYIPMDMKAHSMETFVKEMKMPWPIMDFAHARVTPNFGQYLGADLPNLVLVNRKGEIISASYRGADGKDFQPQEVLMDLASLLQLPPNALK